jgi:hypothetical protein
MSCNYIMLYSNDYLKITESFIITNCDFKNQIVIFKFIKTNRKQNENKPTYLSVPFFPTLFDFFQNNAELDCLMFEIDDAYLMTSYFISLHALFKFTLLSLTSFITSKCVQTESCQISSTKNACISKFVLKHVFSCLLFSRFLILVSYILLSERENSHKHPSLKSLTKSEHILCWFCIFYTLHNISIVFLENTLRFNLVNGII